MKKIKIDFVDFWPNIKKTDNYFFNLLSEYYTVIIDSNNPDFIFYSCFGKDYLKYKCKRIFFTGENLRPDFTGFDFAFSFDFNSKRNHYRLPLFSLYIDDHKMNEEIGLLKSREELKEIWSKKSKFCCMVVSNPNSHQRIDFFKKLSQIIQVDSGGKVLNNVGGRVKDKMEFISDYKFVISFENTLQDGYTTEKILEPIMKDCIPIYWGNKKINIDFNTERFINYHDFESEDDLFEKLMAINENSDLAIEMLSKPVFNEDRQSCIDERKEVFNIIEKIIQSNKTPVAQTYLEKIHILKLNYKRIKKYVQKKYFLIK